MTCESAPDPVVIGQRVADLPSGVARAQAATPLAPSPAGGPAARIHACSRETQDVIVALDEARAHRDLASAALSCPGCSAPLRPWGFARARWLRLACGGRARLRPRRVRCRACAVTHVLLPALAPARHAYAIEVVGQALLAAANGQGHRAIGADLGLPPDTVRGWIRRATARTEWLRVQGITAAHSLDPLQPPIAEAGCGSALSDALSALGLAAAAARRLFGPIAPPWHLVAVMAHGRLLAPLRSD